MQRRASVPDPRLQRARAARSALNQSARRRSQVSAVRKWTLFLRAVIIAIGILVLGVGAFRVGVLEDQRLALWPTFELLHLDRFPGQQPVSRLALFAAVQVTIWTLLFYGLFTGLDAVRRAARRP